MGTPFDELPRLPESGLRHSWGEWGPGDSLGTLNRLTPQAVAAARRACGRGVLIDLAEFAALAAACHTDGRYDFRFTSVPLNVTGGVGSPANSVAVR
jgi:hypothetical protein